MSNLITCTNGSLLIGNAKFNMNGRPTRLMLELIRREKIGEPQVESAAVLQMSAASDRRSTDP